MTRFIDAHHHVLDPERVEYPWMNPEIEPLRRRYDLDELAPHLTAAGVDGTVLVQAAITLGETRANLALAAASPMVVGVVGWADLADPALADSLAEIRAGTGGDRLVGIRHPVHDEPDAQWLLRPAVRRGISILGQAGLAFDLLVRPRELPAAIEVARGEPGMRFVVDHLAKPPIATGGREPWATLLSGLAALPNTVCKLSGLVTEADWGAWTVDELRPYVDHALAVFGPGRLLFGSDWPVCLLAASYEAVVSAATALTDGLSGAERAQLFGGTAEDVYRLGV